MKRLLNSEGKVILTLTLWHSHYIETKLGISDCAYVESLGGLPVHSMTFGKGLDFRGSERTLVSSRIMRNPLPGFHSGRGEFPYHPCLRPPARCARVRFRSSGVLQAGRPLRGWSAPRPQSSAHALRRGGGARGGSHRGDFVRLEWARCIHLQAKRS